MFQVKICGITSVADALVVANAGAGAIGLNFYARSARCVSSETARQIVEALPRDMVKVGLFVNAPADDVCQSFDQLGLDLIQLHGDEPPEYLAQLGGRPVMRALRPGTGGLPRVADYLRRCDELGAMPVMVLLDSLVPGEYGGTGTTCDWHIAQEYVAHANLPPLVLAGGLTAANVAEAIRSIRPAAVDVASGVESSPGRKDPLLVEQFICEAHTVFGS